MKFRKKVVTSCLSASGFLLASILYPIVPCQKIPNVPNPSTETTLCTLNPDIASSFNASITYFGYTPHLTTAFFLVLLGGFCITYAALHFLTLKHK